MEYAHCASIMLLFSHMDPQPEDPLGIGEVDDVGVSTRAYIAEKHLVLFTIVCAASLLVALFFGYTVWLGYEVATQTNGSFDLRLLILPFLPLIAPFSLYQYYEGRVKQEFFEQIGQALGYTYDKTAAFGTVSGTSFNIGHSQQLRDVFSGSYKNIPARMFNFQYTIGYGRNSHTYVKSVFELAYPASLLHVLLNPEHELFAPGDVERVQLEGDFDKHFTLYVTKGAQMEIREIFQPDTMQHFIDQFQNLHMEISGNKIYLISDKTLSGNRQQFLDMQTAMDSVFELIVPNLRSVAADTADMRSATQSAAS